MSKHLLKPTVTILPAWFLSLSLLPSCSEESLEERAREIIESNESVQSQPETKSEGLIRSADGRQFTEIIKDKSTDRSIGFTEEGKLGYKGELKDGKPEGTWSTFFPDGSLRWKGEKRDGVNHGPFTMWYDNGKPKMSGNFKKGKKDGKSTIWYRSGKKWKEQWHRDGEPTGLWKTWDEEGKLIDELNQSPVKADGNESSD